MIFYDKAYNKISHEFKQYFKYEIQVPIIEIKYALKKRKLNNKKYSLKK